MLKRPRIDQDIHFTLNGIPIHMRLDMGAISNQWRFFPEQEEYDKVKFRAAMTIIQLIFCEDPKYLWGRHDTIYEFFPSASNIVNTLYGYGGLLQTYRDGDELDSKILAHEDVFYILSRLALINKEREYDMKISDFYRGDRSVIEFRNIFLTREELYEKLQKAEDEVSRIMKEMDKVFAAAPDRDTAEKIIMENLADQMDKAMSVSSKVFKQWSFAVREEIILTTEKFSKKE